MNTTQTLQTVDINLLFESPTNPRKTFDKSELQELSQSIKSQGLLQNLVLRQVKDKYEIVAGARRYRAAKIAGLTEVPAAVRDLSDEEVLDIQIVENLLRKDVHPLEEAEGYQNLLNSNKKLTVPDIAVKVCKSETYVYQRLKLNDLVDECKELFRKNVLTITYSILLARLQPDDQKKALEYIGEDFDEEDNIIEVRSVSDLEYWIESNVLLDLHSAPFKKDDEILYPEAGSCMSCPKRTGYNQTLFPDIQKKDTCTDPQCFNKKKDLFLESIVQSIMEKEGTDPVKVVTAYYGGPKGALNQGQYKQVKKNECESSEAAIVVGSGDFGKKIYICRSKNCKTHKTNSSVSSAKKTPAEIAAEKKRKEKEMDQEKVRFLMGWKIAGDKKQSFTRTECMEIISELWSNADNYTLTLMAIELKWISAEEEIDSYDNKVFDKHKEKLTAAQIFQVMKVLILDNLVMGFRFARKNDPLEKIATEYKIDKKQIEKLVADERKAAEKAKPVEVKKSVKKKGAAK